MPRAANEKWKPASLAHAIECKESLEACRCMHKMARLIRQNVLKIRQSVLNLNDTMKSDGCCTMPLLSSRNPRSQQREMNSWTVPLRQMGIPKCCQVCSSRAGQAHGYKPKLHQSSTAQSVGSMTS